MTNQQQAAVGKVEVRVSGTNLIHRSVRNTERSGHTSSYSSVKLRIYHIYFHKKLLKDSQEPSTLEDPNQESSGIPSMRVDFNLPIDKTSKTTVRKTRSLTKH